MILQLMEGLQHTLNHIEATTDVGNYLKGSLLDVIGRRIAPLVINKIVTKAMFLDPRFKTLGFG